MIVLGINAFHGDSAAVILRDGRIVAAVEEERFRRIKHWAGFPSRSIAWCLEEAGARLSDVDHVAINTRTTANMRARVTYLLKSRPPWSLVMSRLRTRSKRRGIIGLLHDAFPGERFAGRLHGVEHHVAHLASAFHASPFNEATAVSVDGFGDFSSAAWGVGRGTAISDEGRVFFPHSLGIFYQALTQYLGFPSYGDEYKVMGLAPYGQPKKLDEMRRIVRLLDDGTFELDLAYFIHHRERVDDQWADGSPEFIDHFSPALVDLLGPRRTADDPLEQRHFDIACSVQAMYEDALFHLLRTLHSRHGLGAVVVAGGCGMNSVANGKIRRKTAFTDLYVQAAAGDAGGALGAALSVWHELGGARSPPMDHASWGPAFTDAAITTLLEESAARLAEASCTRRRIDDEAALCRETAAAIADGQVVGWFQGRMEWGPRALGNRSILCDPRRADMKAILNLKIKRRESFRPFAPSILRESVGEWLEEEADVPFMTEVFQIRADRREQIPAVTHVDGSGRLQTVHRETSPRYHRLIDAFREATGVPMVLNTSFNENEPIVCTPGEALDCFLRTKMDMLVVGNWMLRRSS